MASFSLWEELQCSLYTPSKAPIEELWKRLDERLYNAESVSGDLEGIFEALRVAQVNAPAEVIQTLHALHISIVRQMENELWHPIEQVLLSDMRGDDDV